MSLGSPAFGLAMEPATAVEKLSECSLRLSSAFSVFQNEWCSVFPGLAPLFASRLSEGPS